MQQNSCLTSFVFISLMQTQLIKQLWDTGELQEADPVESRLKPSDSSWRGFLSSRCSFLRQHTTMTSTWRHRNIYLYQNTVVKPIQVCHPGNNWSFQCECSWSSPAWLRPWDWMSKTSAGAPADECYSIVLSIFRLLSEIKEGEMAAQIKYCLWSFKITLEA